MEEAENESVIETEDIDPDFPMARLARVEDMKSFAAAPIASKTKRWKCTDCGSTNFKKRKKCFNCGHCKPGLELDAAGDAGGQTVDATWCDRSPPATTMCLRSPRTATS